MGKPPSLAGRTENSPALQARRSHQAPVSLPLHGAPPGVRGFSSHFGLFPPIPTWLQAQPTGLMCGCSSYKTPSSAWGSPSCCLHLTHWFRGIWSIKKPHRSKTRTAPCVNAQNVLLDQCPKAQISCPSIAGVSRLSLALNHYYFTFLFLRNRGFQLRISHPVDHLTVV